MFDRIADAQFRKDAIGQLIFLPRGPRNTGYYINSESDQQTIKALVKLHAVASMLFNLAGMLGSYALASTWQSLYFIHLPISIEARAIRAGIVYLISALVIQLTPILIIQKVYRGVLRAACSDLRAAEPGSVGPLSTTSDSHRRQFSSPLAPR